jgi:iron complex outermembrane recepter protein
MNRERSTSRLGVRKMSAYAVAAPLGISVLSMLATDLSAQNAPTGGGGRVVDARQSGTLAEVVVTAQKREQALQDVPISISVLNGVSLDKATVEGVTEALTRVPGIGINATYQGGGTQVSMRGVSAGAALFSGSSPVSYYLDSVPFGLVRQAIAPDLNAYDMERVEVLRGPQGTLYGASAQNGVVRVLTMDPNVDDFQFKTRTSASSTDGGGESYRGDVAVNVPLLPGKFAIRAVGGYQDAGGWIDRLNKDDVNDAEIRSARLKASARPSEELSIGLSAWISRADYGGPAISDDNGVRAATLPEPIATDFDTYNVDLKYEFPKVSLASSSGYLEYSNDGFLDIGTLVPGEIDQTTLDADVFSQEIILNSKLDGPWRWSIGGMYRDAEDRQFQPAFLNGVLLPVEVDQFYASKSFAAFGEVARSFLDGRLELSGGLRYFEDEVTSDDMVRGIRQTDKFDAVSPRVVLTWRVAENLTTYASYAEGFRSGLPQAGFALATAPDLPSLDADTLHNYELGAKGSVLDGRLMFDTALYFIDWQDVQQSLTVTATSGTFVSALVNGDSASGVGVDFGIVARPVDALEVALNVSWNDLTMDEDVISRGVVLFDAGDRLNISPEYTAGLSFGYLFSLGSLGSGEFSASGNYTSEMDSRTISGGRRTIAFGDSMLIGRTSFAVETLGGWTATLFVDNVTNEQGSPVRFPILREFLPWDTRVRPRTYGIQLEYRF